VNFQGFARNISDSLSDFSLKSQGSANNTKALIDEAAASATNTKSARSG
jgi:hypothetical protein